MYTVHALRYAVKIILYSSVVWNKGIYKIDSILVWYNLHNNHKNT